MNYKTNNIKYALFFVFLITTILLLFTNHENKMIDASYNIVGAHEFKDYIKNENPTLIDIRTPEEFENGHIEGAINIDYYHNFKEKISKLDKSKKYAVYCRSGNRSSYALIEFKEQDFMNIFELKGGIIAWEEENDFLCVSC